jgi:polysaccharide export outer membrane protein
MRINNRWLAMAFVAGVALGQGPGTADQKMDPKLIKYVEDAKKSGQKEVQVQQKAIKAGWSEAAARSAIAYVYGGSNIALSSPVPAADIHASQPTGSESVPANAGTPPRTTTTGGDASKGKAIPAGSTNSEGRSASVAPVPYAYRIGSGDILQVSVWKEPEASAANVVVRPDGMISTPLTKEIYVAGLTPAQAEKLITEKLIKVIQEPDVTVVVTGMASKKVYAVGAVKKEGPIPYTYSMTVMQAIAEAGGLNDYAKRGRIYVLRNENGKESRFPFPYDDILKGKHMELNIALLPGDTLVVPH